MLLRGCFLCKVAPWAPGIAGLKEPAPGEEGQTAKHQKPFPYPWQWLGSSSHPPAHAFTLPETLEWKGAEPWAAFAHHRWRRRVEEASGKEISWSLLGISHLRCHI